MPYAKPPQSRAEPAPFRPFLAGRVHAALVKAGRPLTRGEMRMHIVYGSMAKSVDIQAALDVLVAEGLATKAEGRAGWRVFEVYRAAGEGR